MPLIFHSAGAFSTCRCIAIEYPAGDDKLLDHPQPADRVNFSAERAQGSFVPAVQKAP